MWARHLAGLARVPLARAGGRPGLGARGSWRYRKAMKEDLNLRFGRRPRAWHNMLTERGSKIGTGGARPSPGPSPCSAIRLRYARRVDVLVQIVRHGVPVPHVRPSGVRRTRRRGDLVVVPAEGRPHSRVRRHRRHADVRERRPAVRRPGVVLVQQEVVRIIPAASAAGLEAPGGSSQSKGPSRRIRFRGQAGARQGPKD